MSGSITFFGNAAGAGTEGTDYVKDVFEDLTLPASNNTGLTSNASVNPLGDLFANDDNPKYSRKTLYLKDMVLIEDRSKWINNQATYRMIFHEDFPGVSGYAFGAVAMSGKGGQPTASITTITGGFGISGRIRRLAWLIYPNASATATAQLATDGTNTTTIDFASLATGADNFIGAPAKVIPYFHSTSNETNDLHDYRMIALQDNTLTISGVIVYYENSGANVELPPGTSYVNKSKIVTTAGASLPLGTFGSSLGGTSVYYKNSSGDYAASHLSASTVVSIAQGSSGTNLLALSAGHGASFPAGSGVVVPNGSSHYFGIVRSVSTDTLTVSPTLPFGISNAIYRNFFTGPTFAINASLLVRVATLDFGKIAGVSATVLDPYGRYCLWGENIGITALSMNFPNALRFNGASGRINIQGYFAAADVEFAGAGVLSATFYINGLEAWSMSEGATGYLRKTILTDAGQSWYNLAIGPGASLGATLGIAKINLYQWNWDKGISFGQLAALTTNHSYTPNGAINATICALGTHRRVYADQLYLKGTWTREVESFNAGGVKYSSSSGSAVTLRYYGKDVGIIGTVNGGTLAIDGAGVGCTFNILHSVASEGFHTIQYNPGGSCVIQAIDYVASKDEIKPLLNLDDPYKKYPTLLNGDQAEHEVWFWGANGAGSADTNGVKFAVKFKDVGNGKFIQHNFNNQDATGIIVTAVKRGMYAILGGSAANNSLNAQLTVNSKSAVGPNSEQGGGIGHIQSSIAAGTGSIFGSFGGMKVLNPGDQVRMLSNSPPAVTNETRYFLKVTLLMELP